MTTKRTPTDAEYEALARSYADAPVRADEVRTIEIGPALRMGRPAKGTESTGKTPPLTVRLPKPIRIEVEHRVKAGAADSASELVRVAVVEYLERHPT